MRLRQIEVFHAVYTSGSMTGAATLLHVSQPSVSKVLAHAEQQLGYLLFDRVKGKLVPTPEAHRLFSHVSIVYRDVEQLRHFAENLRVGNSGRIRIASTPAFGLEVLPTAVASFLKKHPDTIFEIETLHLDEINAALLESRVDVGLAFEPSLLPGIEADTISTSRFVVLAPREISFEGQDTLSAADLSEHPFIGLNSRGPLGRILSAYLAPVERDLSIVTWSETYHVAKALAACGVGLTITDEVTAKSGGNLDLQVLPLDPELRFDIQIMHLGSLPLSITTQNFVQHLRHELTAFLSP